MYSIVPVRSQISTMSLVESASVLNTESAARADAKTLAACLIAQTSLSTSRPTMAALNAATADIAVRWPNSATPAITATAVMAVASAMIRAWAAQSTDGTQWRLPVLVPALASVAFGSGVKASKPRPITSARCEPIPESTPLSRAPTARLSPIVTARSARPGRATSRGLRGSSKNTTPSASRSITGRIRSTANAARPMPEPL